MRVHIAVFAALALCCLVSKSAAQTTYKDWVWIDDYTIAGPFNNAYYDNTLTLPVIGSPMYYTDPVTPSVKILGGQRDTQITITAGPDGANFAAGVTAANFTCSTPFQGFGYTELQYDGKDFNPNLNINGLNNADLTAGGNAVQFHTIVASDIPTILHIRIYSGAAIGGGINDYCYFNFSMPGSNIFKEYKTDFTAFQISGLGCDFTRVGAVDAVVDMTDAADSIVSFLSTYGPVPSPSASISVTASQTPTTTPSVSITSTPSASSSTTPTISESPSPSITSTPSPSASPSPTPSPSASSSVSATASPTPTISESPSPSITATPSPSATVSPSLTPSPTVSPSLTASVSVTISETSSKSESRTVSTTPSVTPPPSQSPSPTPTRTPSASPSGTPSPSFSASPTRSNSASVTPTQSYSSSPTKTPSITRSPSQTGSFSRTRSSSVTRSPNMTPTPSVSATTSASISNTRSPSVTASVTLSRTKSPSRTPSPTVGYQIPTYVTYCSGQPSYDPTGRTGSISIDQAFLNAWLLPAPNGGCAHLATYSSEAEFSAIYDSMVRAGATGGKATIIGGRRYSSSSYAWGAGAIRGQAYVEPVDQTASLQIARANCLQGFCLRDMSQVEPITNVNQVGIAVLIDNTGVAHLVPSAGAECYTVELDTFSLIPNSDGGQDFQFVSTLADFDTHQANANLNRQYLARVSGATQNQWIQDELQCATFNVWLGYETNPATLPNTNALRLSAGPSQGTIILSGGQTTCSSYCNFASGFSGIAAPGTDLAVSFVSNTGAGKWSVVPQANSNSGLRARDICAAPAPGYVYICKPSTLSTAWRQSQTTANAAAQVATGTAFYAGGPYSTTIGGVNTVFYFDCNCRTDYRIDLTCLAQRDPRSCTLYYLP